MKSVLIIGLGRFGRHVAKKLRELRHQVLAVDHNEERVDAALSLVTNAQIGDSTNEAFLSSLGVRNFDLCIVTIGESFQSSLETTALLKDLGARFVLSRASRDVPERQMANWAAVRYTSDHVFDYVPLTEHHSIYETAIPPSWLGKSIAELGVRQKYRINILGIKKEGALQPLPGPNHQFASDETVLVLGEEKDIEKFLHIS